jgi:hypothetical protein
MYLTKLKDIDDKLMYYFDPKDIFNYASLSKFHNSIARTNILYKNLFAFKYENKNHLSIKLLQTIK